MQNTATASESLHVPGGAAAATTEPAPTRALRVRVVGATAIASAALVLIDNTVVGWAGSPTYAAPIKEVLAFHAHHSAAVAIAVGLEALNVPLLLLFLTGLHGLVGRRASSRACGEYAWPLCGYRVCGRWHGIPGRRDHGPGS
jgi:hypothetical protein